MLPLRITLVFLEVSAKAIQTFAKMRLGKNQAALPKLNIFPASIELSEERINRRSPELEARGWLRVTPGFCSSKRASKLGGTQPL